MSPKKPIFDKKNVLVIGGAGFIGSHLCDALVKDNKVICLDDFSTSSERNIDHLLSNPDFAFIKHDITKLIDLEKMPELEKFKIKFQGLQEIYCAASPDSPKDYLRLPIKTMLVNGLGTKNSLDLAVKYQARFLYLSSAAIYGEAPAEGRGQKFSFKENYQGVVDLQNKQSCYIESKRYAEILVNQYRHKYQLDAKIARLFSVYGPRMKFMDGRLAPELISLALDKKELLIYGDEKDSGAFCYISDIVNGLLVMMNSTETGPLNFGSNWEVKFNDLAQKIINLTDASGRVKFTEPGLGGQRPMNKIPDLSLVKNKLNWFPIVLIDDGLKETVEYMKAHKGLINL